MKRTKSQNFLRLRRANTCILLCEHLMDRDNAMVQASLLDLGNLVVIFCCGAVVLRPPPKMNTPLVKMKTPPIKCHLLGRAARPP